MAWRDTIWLTYGVPVGETVRLKERVDPGAKPSTSSSSSICWIKNSGEWIWVRIAVRYVLLLLYFPPSLLLDTAHIPQHE